MFYKHSCSFSWASYQDMLEHKSTSLGPSTVIVHETLRHKYDTSQNRHHNTGLPLGRICKYNHLFLVSFLDTTIRTALELGWNGDCRRVFPRGNSGTLFRSSMDASKQSTPRTLRIPQVQYHIFTLLYRFHYPLAAYFRSLVFATHPFISLQCLAHDECRKSCLERPRAVRGRPPISLKWVIYKYNTTINNVNALSLSLVGT